ncbi:hypothetical protein CP061683_0656, partial [Chlamydia psittaci 06-1683]
HTESFTFSSKMT